MLAGACLLGIPAFSDSALPLAYYGVWERGVGFDPALPQYSYLVGCDIGTQWSDIQPVSSNQFDWSSISNALQQAYSHGQMAFLEVNVGPDAPEWVYSNGVPKVYTDDESHAWPYYPYYLNTNYIAFYYNFIHEFGSFSRTLPEHLVKTIGFVQVKTGCTGDECAYKGNPTNSVYNLDVGSPDWENFRLAAFEQFRAAFQDGTNPKIPLLFNNIDSVDFPQAWGWVSSNQVSGYGVKLPGAGRGHHLTSEQSQGETWLPYLVNPQGPALFSRSEMDQTWQKPYYQLNESLGFYWGAISGLNQGLMIWNNTVSALNQATTVNTNIQSTYRFFNRYAGQVDPLVSTRAFIALHDGLDAADTNRFPATVYGTATQSNTNRYLAICSAYAARGARMDDVYAATKGQVYQRSSQTGYNDAGWDITPGNYSRFITQINPDGTSIGLFRIGGEIRTNSPIYSRFARSFENASGRNAMYFDCHDDLFSDAAEQVAFSITYYDKTAGSTWALKYDAGSSNLATALSVTNIGDATWKTVSVTVTNAVLQNNGPNGSDIALVNTDAQDDIFHMVEVQRSARAAASAYAVWANQYPLTQGPTGDDDGDRFKNLYEFGVGGNPTNASDHGFLPAFTLNSGGGSNWCEFVHAQRSDPNSGLIYSLELSDNLVPAAWTNTGYTVVGSGPLANGFLSVTNRIDTNLKFQLFIRLIIEAP